jgi:hypothetical protein
VQELGYFLDSQMPRLLAEMAVKYVIVPLDSEGEIFLGERKYNPQQRKEVEQFLDQVAWLKKIEVTDKIAVYETPLWKNLFWVEEKEGDEGYGGRAISWEILNPTRYKVKVLGREKSRLVFSQTFDELWAAKRDGIEVKSERYHDWANGFLIDSGDWIIEYKAQKHVYYGLIVSGLTLTTCIFWVGYLLLRGFKRKR